MYIRLFSALAAMTLVGACGSGGGDNFAAPETEFGKKFSESNRITNAFPNPTAAGNVPSGMGNVVYTGIGAISGETSATDTLVALGEATLVVDTNSGSVTGGIDQFVNTASAPVTGTINLNSSGALAGNTVPMTGSGTLTDGGTSTAFSMSGNGAFFGPNGQAIRVTLDSGTATTGGFSGQGSASVVVEQ